MDSSDQHAGIEAFSEVRRAIVVAAHADDMETMMGGTVLLLRERGVLFHEVICTAGNIGSTDPAWNRETLAAARVEEAHAAGRLMGVEGIDLFGYPDGELEPTLELRARIAASYRRFMPDALFTFDPSGFLLNHPDHQAVAKAAIDALIPSRMRLYHPEEVDDAKPLPFVKRVFLWVPARIDVVVDVTGVFERKLELGFAHKSQFPNPDSLDWMKRMNKSWGEPVGVEYAEVFRMEVAY